MIFCLKNLVKMCFHCDDDKYQPNCVYCVSSIDPCAEHVSIDELLKQTCPEKTCPTTPLV